MEPIATFREAEGLTATVPKEQAENFGVTYQFECAMVMLDVHSSLDAVGLMAMVSVALAASSPAARCAPSARSAEEPGQPAPARACNTCMTRSRCSNGTNRWSW